MRVQLRSTRRHDENGAVAILVALLAVFLLVLAGFTVDFGMAYSQKQALQNGVDSAALAIVHHEYESELTSPRMCSVIQGADQATADAIALAQVNENAPFGQTLSAGDVHANLYCIPATSGSGELKVTVTVDKNVNTTFGQLAGISKIPVGGTAAAGLGVANGVHALPLALCTYQAQHILDDAKADKAAGSPYRTEHIQINKVWQDGSCDGSGGSGNWGWLDLGGGNGASALGDAVLNGGTITLSAGGSTMDGTPGNKGNSGPVKSAMGQIMGQIETLPVYDTYSGHGANATYHVIGFLSVRLCAFAGAGNPASCWDGNLGNDDMEVQYVDYTPIANIGTVCGVGEPCAGNNYVTKLTE